MYNEINGKITENFDIKLNNGETLPFFIFPSQKAIGTPKEHKSFVFYVLKENAFFYAENGVLKQIIISNTELIEKAIRSKIIYLGKAKNVNELNSVADAYVFNNLYGMDVENSFYIFNSLISPIKLAV